LPEPELFYYQERVLFWNEKRRVDHEKVPPFGNRVIV
jgi:hypothetical protein